MQPAWFDGNPQVRHGGYTEDPVDTLGAGGPGRQDSARSPQIERRSWASPVETFEVLACTPELDAWRLVSVGLTWPLVAEDDEPEARLRNDGTAARYAAMKSAKPGFALSSSDGYGGTRGSVEPSTGLICLVTVDGIPWLLEVALWLAAPLDDATPERESRQRLFPLVVSAPRLSETRLRGSAEVRCTSTPSLSSGTWKSLGTVRTPRSR